MIQGILSRSALYLCLPLLLSVLVASGCLAYNEDCLAPADLQEPDTIVGYLARSFPVRQSLVRTRETSVGNLVADAYMDAYNNPQNPSYRDDVAPVDGAFENSGAIREQGFCEPVEELPGDPVDPPPIRRVDLREVLQFTNRVVVVELTSADLWDVLEHSVSALNSPNPARGHFLQIAGMEVFVDCSRPAEDRVVTVSIGNDPITRDGEDVFRLATNDFLLQAEGNDGFETLAGRPRHNSLGQYSFEVVEDYLLLHSSQESPYDPPEPPQRIILTNCNE